LEQARLSQNMGLDMQSGLFPDSFHMAPHQHATLPHYHSYPGPQPTMQVCHLPLTSVAEACPAKSFFVYEWCFSKRLRFLLYQIHEVSDNRRGAIWRDDSLLLHRKHALSEPQSSHLLQDRSIVVLAL